jgi:hypothetical protein
MGFTNLERLFLRERDLEYEEWLDFLNKEIDMDALELALNKIRVSGAQPDTSEGLAMIFEDKPTSKPIAVTTTVFARQFCESDPYYCYREL